MEYRQRRRKFRQQVLEAYGGKCVCCGETTPEFLTIDHIFKDGAAHRREIGNDLYPWLVRNGFPKDRFRLLCMNCNLAIGQHGKCPHARILENIEAALS